MFIQNRKQLISNILLLCLVSFGSLRAQEEYVRHLNSIPVIDGAGALTNIYSGSINNFEYQYVDIDGDNDFDLLVGLFDGRVDYHRNDRTPISAYFVF